jgi:hypothetical protein
MKKIVYSLPMLFALAIASVINISYNEVSAHNFYKNEASVFFTLIKQFEVENELVQSNFPKNASLALEHAENTARLLKDIFYFDEDNSNYTDFRNTYDLMTKDLNTTTSALISANMADEILRQYGLALGFDPAVVSNLANMSMSMSVNMSMTSAGYSAKNRSDMMMSTDSTDQKNGSNSQNVNSNITKQVHYQTATMLAGSLKNLFLRDLQNAPILNSTGLMHLPMEVKMASINDLGEGIDNLISAINRKTTLDEVMSIVHGQIHPNVFMAFDLKLKGD